MNTFLKHESCPSCGSKDNLARYSDGSAYCFSAGCGYREKSSHTPVYKKTIPNKTHRDTVPNNILYDVRDFPRVAIQWLFQYGITDTLITQHGIGFNPDSNGLFLPIKHPHTNTILAYQERYFLGDKKYLTYRLQGVEFKNLVWVGWGNSTFVLVEDIISAIKINSLGYTAIALLGVKLNYNCLNLITKHAKRVVVWLDNDNPEVIKFSFTIHKKISLLNMPVRVVKEEGNPKEKTREKICKTIN